MTDEVKNKRSRRRFLADMLFVGGGLTAAALLARTQLGEKKITTQHPPDVAGAVEPTQVCETPNVPLPGEPVPPDIEGDYAVPDPVHSKGDYIQVPQPSTTPTPTHREPKLGGKPVSPEMRREGE